MKHLMLVTILFLTGCTTTVNVTDKEYVPTFLGKARTTKDMFLCFDEHNPKFNSQLIINYGFAECPIHKHVASLPINTEIEMLKVVKHTRGILLTLDSWYVLGSYRDIDFYYDLGWVPDEDGSFYYTKGENVPWKILHITKQ